MERTAEKEYTCPICGKKHSNDQYCPIVIKKMQGIKLENQSYIMGAILLECLECGVDFIETLKEIVYFVEKGTSQLDGAKFFDIDLFVTYFASALGCSPSKFGKRMRELPDRFAEIIEEECSPSVSPSFDKDNNLNSIDMELEGEFDPFWKMVNEHKPKGFGPSPVSVFLMKDTSERRPTYHFRLVYQFNDSCFNKEKTHYSTYSCELYAEKEGRLKEYFENNCNWTEIAKEIPCTFHEAYDWVSKLAQATRNGILRWNVTDNTDSIFCSTVFGQSEIEIRIAKEVISGDNSSDKYREGFGDYICIRESDRKMYHYGGAFETYYINGPNDYEEEINKEPIIKKLGYTIDRWQRHQKEVPLIKNCSRKKIKKSDVLSVAYSFVCSQKSHTVIPYCGVVTILTPEGVLIEENVYLGRCNACGVYYVFKRDYYELCKKGQPLCKVIDASTGKTLSDSNFSFNSSSVLSEMGYNVQASISMGAKERQEILRKAIEEKKVSINEILNLLELQIRLHSDSEKYKSAVEKWKEDSDFVKSYGINSGKIKRMTDMDQT